jgi:hypothetical protein
VHATASLTHLWLPNCADHHPQVLGFISFEAMDLLYSVDPRFKRVYERNYFMLIIGWVKNSVPFLM